MFLHSSLAYYDVAVWRVKPVKFSTFVRPICLPSGPQRDIDRYAGRSAETMGMGCPLKYFCSLKMLHFRMGSAQQEQLLYVHHTQE